MGGTPYTSLGCANCKKRRIKCDLGEPECSKCLKKGVPCPGYDKDRNFLHHTLVSTSNHNHGNGNGGRNERPVPQLVGHLRALSLPTTFNMNAEVRTQLFSTFVETFFTSKAQLNSKDDSWYYLITRFPTLAGESGLLDRSVIAFASVFLGKRRNDNRLLRYGIEVYNSALGAMAQILSHNFSLSLYALYATVVFHTYETMHSSDDMMRCCFNHVQGATAVLNHRQYVDQDDNGLTKAMLNRQKWAASFFITNPQYASEANWKCLILGRDESPMDKLFGILADCTLIRRRLEDILARRQYLNIEAACEPLLQRCIQLEEKLQVDWLKEASQQLAGNPYPSTSRSKEEYDPSTLPLDPSLTPYEFPNLFTAKTYLLFWVTSVAIRRVIYQIETLLLRPDPDPARMLFYASEICRSVAYCIQPKTQTSAGQAALFAVSQASQCYIECGERDMFMWCQGIYSIIVSRGFDIASLVSQAEWKLWHMTRSQRAPT